VIVTSSPRSTRSSSWPSLFFASNAPTSLTGASLNKLAHASLNGLGCLLCTRSTPRHIAIV
jgi:hypothetical protein